MPDNDSSGFPPSLLSPERAGEIYDGLAHLPGWDGDRDGYIREERIDDLVNIVRFHEFTRSVKGQAKLNRKRGRPREWLIDDLIIQIGAWYMDAAGGRQKTGGRRRDRYMFPTSTRDGPFVRIVEEIVVMLYPERAGTAIGELVRHAVRRYFQSKKIH